MYTRRVHHKNAIEQFANPSVSTCYQERKGRAILIQQNLARTRMVQSLQQRLNCPSRVPKPKPPAPVESRYEEILYPPITYDGYQSEMFPWALARIQKIVPLPPNNKETQVEDEDVFNFCIEVQPYLETVVGTAVTQAMHEATNDEEHFLEQAERSNFRALWKSERAEHTRVEKQDRRLREERQRREIQFQVGCKTQKERAAKTEPMHRVKVQERNMTMSHVLEGSHPNDYQADAIKKELEVSLHPRLLEQVDVMSSSMDTSRDLLNEMVSDVLLNRSQSHAFDTGRCSVKSCSSNDDAWVLQDDEEWQILSGKASDAQITTDDDSKASSVYLKGSSENSKSSSVYFEGSTDYSKSSSDRRQMSVVLDDMRKRSSGAERKKTAVVVNGSGSSENIYASKTRQKSQSESSAAYSWAGVIKEWM